MNEYDFKKIEVKWQDIWEDTHYGIADDNSAKPKHYNLVEFPYPSGAGLHVGHCMGYGASDAYCRMRRMQGDNVMFPIGWDAFGLPTENYAIKNKIKPQKATEDNIAIFKKQMKSLGYAFDWSREVNTSDPTYYKWTQWIFLQFYKHGIQNGKLISIDDNNTTTPRLAFQAEMPVNWCPSCKIVLANEEVIANNCERCGTATQKRKQKQWMLRITDYADRLIDDLDTVDYLEQIKTQQKNWIGKSSGVILKEKVKDMDIEFEVYDSVPQTFVAQTFAVIAPEHPIVKKLVEGTEFEKSVMDFVKKIKEKKTQNKFDVDKELDGIFTGRYIDNPFGAGDLQIWVASYVLADYGTGIVNCSAHDERDFNFAKKYDIPLKIAMLPADKELSHKVANLEVYYGRDPEGIIQSPEEFKGMTWKECRNQVIDYIEAKKFGYRSTQYKLRDWIFSRQHYWGEPIPIIHCDKCGVVPVPESDLPIKLPDVENYEPTDTGESPLAKIDSWVNTECPNCGGKAKRETDTMPNWAGSSWYFLRYCDVDNNKEFAASDKLKYWTPVDLYNGGAEHITLHLLYSRFWHKFLFDLGVVPTSEPYQKRIMHGIILGPDGQKMSKSKGNVINPDEIVDKFGADTLRAYIMFIGPYDQESAWSNAGIMGVHRFLKRVWQNQNLIKDTKDTDVLLVKLNQAIKGVTEDLENFQMNTVVSKLMELNNTIEKEESISKESFKIFLQLLYPACPHIASELWAVINDKNSIENSVWPKPDEKYLIADEIEIAVSVNGKTRQIIKVKSNATQDEIETIARADDKIAELIKDQKIQKTIYIAGRIINFVI